MYTIFIYLNLIKISEKREEKNQTEYTRFESDQHNLKIGHNVYIPQNIMLYMAKVYNLAVSLRQQKSRRTICK